MAGIQKYWQWLWMVTSDKVRTCKGTTEQFSSQVPL